jgi:type III secretion protein Q
MLNNGATGTARAGSVSAGARPMREGESGLALPLISPAEVASINAFYCRRPAVNFTLGGDRTTIAASWPPESGDVSGRYLLELTVDGAPGALILPSSLIKALIAKLDPAQGLDGLNPHQRALLLELAVADELSALEASIGSRLSIIAVRAAGNEQSVAVSLFFNIAVDGLASCAAELQLPPRDAARFAQCLDRAASRPTRAAGGMEDAAIGVPVAVAVRVAATTCSVGEIATLSPGDIVMADDSRRQPHTAVAVVGEHLAAPVELTAAGAQIIALPVPIRGSLWEWSMENGNGNGGNRAPADLKQKTDLDDIPVKLLFELGRVELSLAEIRKLAPGALVAVPRPLDESVDIVANGRRIGRGSLVQIGSNIGVRITRLFQDV